MCSTMTAERVCMLDIEREPADMFADYEQCDIVHLGIIDGSATAHLLWRRAELDGKHIVCRGRFL